MPEGSAIVVPRSLCRPQLPVNVGDVIETSLLRYEVTHLIGCGWRNVYLGRLIAVWTDEGWAPPFIDWSQWSEVL